jgi:chromosome segregation ATPase
MQRKFSTATNVRKRTKDVAADDQTIRLKEENLVLAAQLDELRSQIAFRDQELSALKPWAGRMAEEKEDIAKQLSDVRSQLVACEQDLATSKTDATRITDENGALMGQVTALQTELEDGRKQFAQAVEVSEVLKRHVDSMETRVGELEGEVSRLETSMEEHSRRVRDMLGGFIIRWWVGLR